MSKTLNLLYKIAKRNTKCQQIRFLSSAVESIPENAKNSKKKVQTNFQLRNRMKGTSIHNYGDLNELQFSNTIRKPIIQKPNEVLVKVLASSVNPLDVAMIGKKIFKAFLSSNLSMKF